MTERLAIAPLAAGDVEVEVIPAVGARLHRLRFRGHDLLRTPADLRRHLDHPWFWGSYPMAPWCNRIEAGRTRDVAGHDLDLVPNFPDRTAIHGQVARAAWTQEAAGSFRVSGGGDDWPWPYEVQQVIAPSPAALEITLSLTNLADRPMPAGLGIHPWFVRPVRVRIAGAAGWTANPSPEPQPAPVAGRFDRRALTELPDGLDATWTDLEQPPVTIAWPGTGIRATMSTTPPVPYIVAASPGEVDAVAVEPETHAPAGIRRLLRGEPGALELLPPAATMTLAIRLAFDDVPGET